ncbi:MAG: hypothetical protein EOP11_08310 [Proteobacteria bacterium]|nr:MAG: hypothetical protein EOP11_08310 [Pseudomonadota bacterium]
MKKYISFPTLALVVTFAVACGKQDSSLSPAASGSADTGATVAAVKAEPVAPPPTLLEWCDQSGGFMHNDKLCEVQVKRMYGRNTMVVVEDWWPTSLEVKANDTISIEVGGKPRMKLGADEIESATSRAYVAQSDGTIAFQSKSIRARFEVRQITVKRCYSDTWQLKICPKS